MKITVTVIERSIASDLIRCGARFTAEWVAPSGARLTSEPAYSKQEALDDLASQARRLLRYNDINGVEQVEVEL